MTSGTAIKKTRKLPSSGSITDNLVWIDCEMTGLDIDNGDTLIEIAVIVTDDQLEVLAESPSLIINQPKEVMDKMGEWCTRAHGESGLTQAVLDSKLSMAEAEEQVLALIKKHTKPKSSPLAGNSVGQDAIFLRKYMPKIMDHLHYRIVDVSTIKELARRWYPEKIANVPKKKTCHRALDDIKESIAELEYYRKHFFVEH